MINKKESAYSYLNAIDTGPLLNRDQEEQLIKSVEIYQKQILSQLITTLYARQELKSYLVNLNASKESIVDLSKKLDSESSKDFQTQIETTFNNLILELDTDNTSSINSMLDDMSLTGTIIHGVVTEIKKKHTKIQEAEFKYKSIKNYFSKESDEDIRNLILTDSSELKAKLKNEFSLNDVRLTNKLNEWKQVLAEVDDVTKLIKDHSFNDVKSVYSSIASLESQASRFKNQLITKNLRLVVSRAKKFINKGLDFDDLIQEGNIGLIKSIDKFDSSKRNSSGSMLKVSTYATWWIDQSIRRAISNKGKTVRVPTHIEWMETKLNQASHRLTGRLQRPPTLKELAKEAGYPLSAVEDLMIRPQHEIGIDEELSSGMSLTDILSSDPLDNPYNFVEQKLLKERIRSILGTMNPKSEKLIRLRFGIGEIPDDEGMTLQEIANNIGITKQGVRVRECAAFKEFKKRAKGLQNE